MVDASIDTVHPRPSRDAESVSRTAAPTYYSVIAGQQLRQAQAVLDLHVTSSATGRCVECGTLGPCWRRENAVVVFSRTLRLPVRRPGASQPALINARRVSDTAGLAGSDRSQRWAS